MNLFTRHPKITIWGILKKTPTLTKIKTLPPSFQKMLRNMLRNMLIKCRTAAST